MPEIAARGLVKRLRSTQALRGIDLEVPAGALWGLVGADGAGKTTLLRCLAGLYRPDAGTATPGAAGQSQIGFAPQGFHLYGDLTVLENMLFFGGLYGIDATQLVGRAGRDHPTLVQERHLLAALDLVEVGACQQDRRTAGVQLLDQAPELAPRHRVDAGGRLVEQ